MRVVVTGAGGQTGSLVVKKLIEHGIETTAVVRSEVSKNKLVDQLGAKAAVNIVLADVTNPDTLRQAFVGMDACVIVTSAMPRLLKSSLLGVILAKVFTLGYVSKKPSFYFDEGQSPETVDWMGQCSQIDAAKASGLKHVVLVSSMAGTKPDHFLNTQMENIVLWKRKAECYLVASGIPYTIIHPGGLLPHFGDSKPAPGGRRQLYAGIDDSLMDDGENRSQVPREDVAAVCVASLLEPQLSKGSNACYTKEQAEFKGSKKIRILHEHASHVEVLVEFVEANLCQTTGKAWAQALLYKKEGEEWLEQHVAAMCKTSLLEDDPAPTDELSDQDSDPPAVLQSDDIQVSASESSFTPQPSQSAPSTVRLQDLGEGVSKPKVGSDGSEQESPQRVEDAAQPPQPPQSEADEAFPDAPMASKVEPEERVAEEADAALSEVPPELAPGKAGKKEKKEKKDKKEKKKDKRAKKEKKEKSDPTTEAQPRESKRQAPQVAIVAAQLDSSSDSSSAEIGHLDILAGGKTCLVDASRAMLCQIPHSSHVKSSFTDAVNGSTGFHDLETIGRLSETEVLDFLESLRVYPGHKLRLLRAIECLRHAVLGADRREEQMLEDDAALQRLCSQNSELTRGKVEAENESKKWQQETRRLLEVIRDQGAELQKQRDKVLELEELVQAQTEQVDFLTSQLHALAQAAGPETLNDMFQSHKGRGVDWGLRDTESPQPDLPVRARAFSDSDSLTMPTPLGGYLHEPAVEPPRAKFAKSMEIPSANAEVDNLIRCLATALQNKVILSVGKPRPHTGSVECLAACAIFLEPVCKDMLEKQVRPREACGEGFPGNEQSDFGTPLSSMCSPLMSKESSAQVSESLNKPSHPFNSIAVRRIPNKWDIYDFLELVIHALEVHPEVSVVTLVYLDRFCETSGIALTPDNWQRLTITAMMLASKVWYDESYENVDFAQKFDLYSLAEINTFERIFLKCVSYDMSVKAVQYAQTYFFLRTLGAKDSVEFTLQPLDEVGESPVKPAWAWGLVHRKLRWVFITSWMAHPAIMTVPFMTPEMIHGPSHYHPMAMIVDPAMVMPKFKEKHEKKSKKERDRDREKQKRKAEKTTDASATKRHEQEKRQLKQKEKVAKRKAPCLC
ncbi:SARED1 [Symbiodinium sp. CCMP2592]|nr:SARED1 [Symbiodinium sp. CCMP2592]